MKLTPLILGVCLLAPISFAADYKSLKDFCIGTQADTTENCECGQATADRIMSDEEQGIALGLMQGDREAMVKHIGKFEDVKAKLDEVTKGCGEEEAI